MEDFTQLDQATAQRLRHDIYSKPLVTREDLSNLIAMAAGSGAYPSQEYVNLICETAKDLIAEQVEPTRYVQLDDAQWLISALADATGLDPRLKIQILIDVIRYSVSLPDDLVVFTVAEIEKAIVANGKATASDIEALDAAVFAATEGSSLHVTRASAEALMRIAHATSANDPAFDAFFAKAVGNYLMGAAFRGTPTLADEKELHAWLDEKPSLTSFVERMFSGFRWPKYETEEQKVRIDNTLEQQDIADAGRIDATETSWLLDHLSRQGKLTSAELKLLDFIQRESGALPASLSALLDQQAA